MGSTQRDLRRLQRHRHLPSVCEYHTSEGLPAMSRDIINLRSEQGGLAQSPWSVAYCRSLPQGDEKMMCYVRRREWLSRQARQPCEKCGDTTQQQLVDHIVSHTAKWKCRICKSVYFYEPNVASDLSRPSAATENHQRPDGRG